MLGPTAQNLSAPLVTGPNNIQTETRFQTTTPDEIMTRVVDFFKQQEGHFGKLASIAFVGFFALALAKQA